MKQLTTTMKHFTIFSLISLLFFQPFQIHAEESISCSFDPSQISQGSLIKVDCDGLSNFSGIFQMNGNEYLASSGYLVLSDTYGHWTIGADGILDRTWTKEKFQKFFPVEKAGYRDRQKLQEYDLESEVFRLATEIEETTGLQINYGEDDQYVKKSMKLYYEPKLMNLLHGIQCFIAQFPDGFFKDVVPGINISLTSISGDETGLDLYVLGKAKIDTSERALRTRFSIELTSVNTGDEQIVQTLNHEFGHILDFLLAVDRSKSSFTDVIGRLKTDPKRSDFYIYDHEVIKKRSKKDFQYPDMYSNLNDMEYIGRLFEYCLTPGFEYLFEEGSFYRKQAELALDRLIAFDPAFSDLPINFKQAK